MMTRHPAAAPAYPMRFDPGTALFTAATAAALAQGRAARGQARGQAALLEQQAAQARQTGAADAARIRADALRRGSRLRARTARAGVLLDGSPITRLGDLADVAEVDAQTAARAGAARAGALQNRAGLERSRGRAREQASAFRAGTTLLRGLASFGP